MSWSLYKIPVIRISRPFALVCHVRTLHLKVNPDCKEDNPSKPLTFSTSKASHRHWSFEKSMGSEDKRPLWKVLPVSFLIGSILIWAAFRKETEIDEQIYKPIEQLQPDPEINETDTEVKK
ncbi:ubiquinol-cytochrome-c reductase complex assembly factor 4 [Pelobates fuscus]|uniref:ubiquinol-cytochrome-c reductase complex assembly factor 4 n=1 Tax=Pelobates fuscus TaxID=191477 RepID=UPI002FE4E3A1